MNSSLILYAINRTANTYSKLWRNKPDIYWVDKIKDEVAELELAVVGSHQYSPEHELLQIASICVNFIDKRGTNGECIKIANDLALRRLEKTTTHPDEDAIRESRRG